MLNKAELPMQRPRSAVRVQSYQLIRSLHLYASMASLLVVLFFAATGITLNHPDWAFGNTAKSHTYTGTLPAGWKVGDQVNWLEVAESLRAAHGLRGRVSDTFAEGDEASISFRGPGYAADAFIQPDGQYTLKVTLQGPVAVLNDLHKGRDAGSAWAWVIDLSGGFLLLVALTGLGLSLYLRKTRKAALLTLLVGTLLALGLAWLAI
ncbi:PepSY-associated TM helix domain-containing protein [Meiothermus rufus]|uniref:PepSY-associated TM helix domain-containing protein n=1 Tax=Meiothermus rufus TaxID=604332 RepID=UPI000419EDCC|nr:PepSY-associated TM helix domain-containing protein [Meiothermus rufus]